VIQGVVFDFDGVIANTELLHLQAYQQVLGRRGWTLEERAYFERYLGYNDEDLLLLYSQDHQLPLDDPDIDTLVREKTDVYQGSIEGGSVLYPGAANCVREIAKHFPIAIASGSLRDEILRILRAEHLLDVFRAVVSSDDVPRSQPAPDPYLKAAADLGLAPAQCVAIEDSHWGLTAARAAGMRTIGLTTTSTAAKLAAADLILERVEQITVETVKGLFTRA